MERREAVLTVCVPVSLARYVTWVGESSKQANDASLMGEEVFAHWQEAESCSITFDVMSAILRAV